jgi:probable LLM family oxidoreductase
MQIGIDSFAAILPDPASGRAMSATQRIENLIEEIEVADQVGIDVFGIGEHHRAEFLDSAPAVILAAAAARTNRIRLTSAVTVLSAVDPVRVFQQFATLDLISKGRAEMVVGRGSLTEAYPLFGFNLKDYDALFAEKLGLLLRVRDETAVHWTGEFRPPLSGQGIYPRPHQKTLPIWIGVGGSPQSFARAGTLGMPLMIAVIGGGFDRFRPLVDLYRSAGRLAGHTEDKLKVGVHAVGFVAESMKSAKELFFPGWAHMVTQIGKERGWPPASRDQFDAMCSPDGAFLVGDPATVATKIKHVADALGGVERVTVQMSTASMDHQAMKQSISLLGQAVAPAVQNSIPAV